VVLEYVCKLKGKTMQTRTAKTLTQCFQNLHENIPAPFNPLVDHKAAGRYSKVTRSMEVDGWYSNHSREECKVEWARRYDALKGADA